MPKFDISKFAEGLSVPESGTLREIELKKLVPNPQNFYPEPQGSELDELIASLLANGLLEPLTVVPAATVGEYRLISGHSRLAALHYAVQQDARFERVPCRVLPPLTGEQELCALIEANRQRVKSSALLAQEAKLLTDLYRRRKEAGEELPGRIRARVAAALHVSPTKLGNVSAIENGLKFPALRDLWSLGNIPEDAALEIARLSEDNQHALHGWAVALKKPWTIKTVREFRDILHGRPRETPAAAPASAAPRGEGSCAQCRAAHPGCDACCEKCVDHCNAWQGCRRAEAAPEMPEGWVPVAFVDGREKPPRAGEYWCRMNCGGTDIYQSARWDAVLARWEFLNGVEIDAECLGWYPLPKRVEKGEET